MLRQHPNRTDSLKVAPQPATVTASSVGASAGAGSTDAESGVVPADAIRTRAFQMWERAGKPDGDGVTFWLDAERELIIS